MSFRKKLLLWFVLMIAFGIFIGNLNIPRLYQLNKHGTSAEAVVTKLTPEFHNTYHYVYTVAGIPYEGIGQIDDWGIHNAGAGTKISIHYLANSPGVSAAGNIRPQLNNELFSVGSIVLIFPLIIVWRISVWMQKRRKRASAEHQKIQ